MTRPLTEILKRIATAPSSGDADYLARCAGKDSFATQPQAMAVIRAMRLDKGGTINAYRCPHCRKWHVGRGKG